MNPILWLSSVEQPILRLDLEQRVANTGSPDWTFMEGYINKLPFAGFIASLIVQ